MFHKKNNIKVKSRGTAGNALFLILIAVALFGALSYAVTRSSRGGGTIDRETLLLSTAELYNITSMIQSAATRLLLQGCTGRQIAVNSRAPFDATVRPNPECDIYGISGGAVTLDWRGTSIMGAGVNVPTSYWNPYYSIDIGNGYQIPITIWWYSAGGVESLLFNGYAERTSAYSPLISSATFDRIYAVASQINKNEGLPSPLDVGTAWLPAYNDAYFLTIGDNTSGTDTDWIEIDLIINRKKL